MTVELMINGPVTVEYTFHPLIKGRREKSTGAPLEPDESAHVEITDILYAGSSIIDIVDSMYVELMEDQLYTRLAEQER